MAVQFQLLYFAHAAALANLIIFIFIFSISL